MIFFYYEPKFIIKIFFGGGRGARVRGGGGVG